MVFEGGPDDKQTQPGAIRTVGLEWVEQIIQWRESRSVVLDGELRPALVLFEAQLQLPDEPLEWPDSLPR